jgi:hypothetical protein
VLLCKFGHFKAENARSTDTLVAAMINNMADNSVTAITAVLRSEAIEYLSRSEILLFKNPPDE